MGTVVDRPKQIRSHHLDYNQHQMADVSILHWESDWFRTSVAEAIHVMKEQPTLNRGRERHTLPQIYREIITPSRDPPPTGGGVM